MRSVLTTVLILCIVGAMNSFAQNSQKEICAIAFYNVENLFHPSRDTTINDVDFTPEGSYRYTPEIYAKKLKNLAQVLSQLGINKTADGPAIIGLAEVENLQVLKDLAAEETIRSRNYKIVHFDSPDRRGIDVALFYHPQYFRVLEAESIFVPLEENGRNIYTRDVLYVKGILLGDTTHVLVNHWPSRSGGEAASLWRRKAAAQVNRDKIDIILSKEPTAKIIVMGDLNDDPVSPSVVETLQSTDKKNHLQPNELYNPWVSFFKKGLGTLGYNNSWNLFDQIMISSSYLTTGPENKGWKYLESEIFNRKFLISQFGKYKGFPHRSYSGTTWLDGYSDHFPTIIYLVR